LNQTELSFHFIGRAGRRGFQQANLWTKEPLAEVLALIAGDNLDKLAFPQDKTGR
jgi:hypothetical protein